MIKPLMYALKTKLPYAMAYSISWCLVEIGDTIHSLGNSFNKDWDKAVKWCMLKSYYISEAYSLGLWEGYSDDDNMGDC